MKIDLIEQLGGYEKAKAEFEALKKYPELCDGEFAKNDSLLLQYRRQHNIFEVGDEVVFKNNWTANDLVLTIDGPTGKSIRLDTVLDLKKHFRHANPEEIQAGRRSEVCGG